MANVHEIVTIQVGHYSNFIGAHWWNLQEGSFVYDSKTPTDINHDVLFREGRTRTGEETYVPRLVAIDLKGSLETLRKDGILYGDQKSTHIPWTGKVNVYKTEPQQKNDFLRDIEKEEARGSLGNEIGSEKDICQASQSNFGFQDTDEITSSRKKFYDLDEKVELWSDFVATHYHPRSIYLIDQFTHDKQLDQFEHFGIGRQIWANEKVSDEIEDKIRCFAEECDNLQGFQLIVDSHNGFAGVGCGISSLLQDEYGSKTTISIPSYPVPSQNTNNQAKNYSHLKMMSMAYTLQRLSSFTSLVVPVSLSTRIREPTHIRDFPFLNYNPYLHYHSSAVIASALDTVSLLYRVKKSPLLLTDFTNNLAYRGMKVAGLSISLPFPVNPDCFQADFELVNEKETNQSLSFGLNLKRTPSLFQMVSLRGVNDVALKSCNFPSTSKKNSKTSVTREESLQSILKSYCPSKFSTFKEIRDACYTGAPFPNIFNSNVERSGYINMAHQRPELTVVNHVPALAGLHCNSSVGEMLNETWDFWRRQDLRRFDNIFSNVFEFDDIKEMLENLQQLSFNYFDVNV